MKYLILTLVVVFLTSCQTDQQRIESDKKIQAQIQALGNTNALQVERAQDKISALKQTISILSKVVEDATEKSTNNTRIVLDLQKQSSQINGKMVDLISSANENVDRIKSQNKVIKRNIQLYKDNSDFSNKEFNSKLKKIKTAYAKDSKSIKSKLTKIEGNYVDKKSYKKSISGIGIELKKSFSNNRKLIKSIDSDNKSLIKKVDNKVKTAKLNSLALESEINKIKINKVNVGDFNKSFDSFNKVIKRETAKSVTKAVK